MRISLIVISIALALTPQAQTDPQFGTVEGTIQISGQSGSVAEAEIALEGGPADAQLVQTLVRGLGNRQGIVFNPSRIGTIEEVLQDATDASGEQGFGPGFPGFDAGIDSFKAAALKRFVAVSNSEGHFTIKNVPPGRYTIRAEREGFILDTSPDGVNSRKVTVEARQTANVVVSMLPGGVISGHVRDATGQPLPNADVQVMAKHYRNGYIELQPVLNKPTDDHGAYRLFWLSPGEYYILASPRITQSNSVPPPKTYYPSGPTADKAVSIVIHAGDRVPGLDIEMRNDHFAKVSGKLITSIPADEMENMGARLGGGLTGSPVITLLPRDLNRLDVGDGVTEKTVAVVRLVNGAGTFETSGILPGSYFLSGRVPESNNKGGAPFSVARVPVDIGDADVAGITIVVDRQVTATGTVTVDGKPPGKERIRIMLQPDGDIARQGLYQIIGQRIAPADAAGAFSMIGLPPGLFRVEMGPALPPNLYLSDVRQAGRSVFDSGFEVTAEAPQPLQVFMTSGAAIVDGTVEDALGKPFSGATVVLVPALARRQNRALYHAVESDASGRFSIHSVAPGAYKLFAWDQVVEGGAYYNALFLDRFEDRGRPINVSQGSTTTERIKTILADNVR